MELTYESRMRRGLLWLVLLISGGSLVGTAVSLVWPYSRWMEGWHRYVPVMPFVFGLLLVGACVGMARGRGRAFVALAALLATGVLAALPPVGIHGRMSLRFPLDYQVLDPLGDAFLYGVFASILSAVVLTQRLRRPGRVAAWVTVGALWLLTLATVWAELDYRSYLDVSRSFRIRLVADAVGMTMWYGPRVLRVVVFGGLVWVLALAALCRRRVPSAGSGSGSPIAVGPRTAVGRAVLYGALALSGLAVVATTEVALLQSASLIPPDIRWPDLAAWGVDFAVLAAVGACMAWERRRARPLAAAGMLLAAAGVVCLPIAAAMHNALLRSVYTSSMSTPAPELPMTTRWGDTLIYLIVTCCLGALLLVPRRPRAVRIIAPITLAAIAGLVAMKIHFVLTSPYSMPMGPMVMWILSAVLEAVAYSGTLAVLALAGLGRPGAPWLAATTSPAAARV